MDYKDYYQTLGVPKTATQAEIKKAFRKLARDFHPDKNPGDKTAEKKFKDVNEAHAVLSDKEKRQRYDTLGADWEAFSRQGGGEGDPFGPGGPFAGFAQGFGAGARGAGGRGSQGGNVRWEFRTAGGGPGDAAGFSDFFRMVFGDAGSPSARSGSASRARGSSGGGTSTGTDASGASFADILSQMGYQADEGPARRPAGVAEAAAELTLEEAFHGTTRLVEVEGKRYEVSIPRGVDTGSRVKLSGKGPGGRDLIVTVKLLPHAIFTRKGADLERELLLTLEEALLGAEVPVTTLKGRILLTIPAGTQTGKTFRLTGQGMPRLRGDGAGDLYVRTRVVLPKTLDDDATAAAKRFLELVHQPDPRAT
jgi:DnaJ-class molecular chaperone